MAQTPQLIMLFYELKHDVASFPVLTWFDADRPTFFNTDWSSEGMGWIMIQPATDKEYHHVSTVLKDAGTCLFNLSPHGSQLQPILFGSRSCTDFERKYHSFVG